MVPFHDALLWEAFTALARSEIGMLTVFLPIWRCWSGLSLGLLFFTVIPAAASIGCNGWPCGPGPISLHSRRRG
jgi:hypothetical protein